MARLLPFATLLLAATAIAQSPAPSKPAQPLQTHQVNPDGSITFRYPAPTAAEVSVSIDYPIKPALTMTRGADGVWSATTPPLPPEWYNYSLAVDGTSVLDPRNPHVIHNLVSLGDTVLVPGALLGKPPAPWELTAVHHGRLDHHTYTTHILKNLPENQESYIVYTPPNYDPQKKGGYPILYLLHGWSDAEDGWTSAGHADYILDTLIAAGSAQPMIVVMPLGYGDYDFVTHGFSVWQDPAKVSANVDLFSQGLFTEIMPAVEHTYNVAPGRENHAIAGLSMGGLETLAIGLAHPETFAYVAGMSSAVFGEHFAAAFPSFNTPDIAKKDDLRLLWVACGAADQLSKPNRDFIALARSKGFDVTAVETTGAHTWLTWRDNLVHVAPLLFQPK
jgi:enterochelin esterase family protein